MKSSVWVLWRSTETDFTFCKPPTNQNPEIFPDCALNKSLQWYYWSYWKHFTFKHSYNIIKMKWNLVARACVWAALISPHHERALLAPSHTFKLCHIPEQWPLHHRCLDLMQEAAQRQIPKRWHHHGNNRQIMHVFTSYFFFYSSHHRIFDSCRAIILSFTVMRRCDCGEQWRFFAWCVLDSVICCFSLSSNHCS